MTTKETTTQVPMVQEKGRHRWMPQWMSRGFPHWASQQTPLSLFDEMDRMFDRMMAHPLRGGMWSPSFGPEAGLPRVDVIDREKEILLRAEVPGVRKEDLEVTITDHTVTLRGKYQHGTEREEGDYYYSETAAGEFSRCVPLPTDIDSSKAKAVSKDGVIEITLPKQEAVQRRRIDIQTG
jgi:HSP20 family protein